MQKSLKTPLRNMKMAPNHSLEEKADFYVVLNPILCHKTYNFFAKVRFLTIFWDKTVL